MAGPAKWTTKPAEVTLVAKAADGSFTASIPLYDNGVKQLTLTFTIDAARAVRVDVKSEPGATLTGFTAWSDL